MSKQPAPQARWSSFEGAQKYVRSWCMLNASIHGKREYYYFDLVIISTIYCVTKNNLVISKATDFCTAVACAEWMEFDDKAVYSPSGDTIYLRGKR